MKLFEDDKPKEIDHRYTDTVICPYCGYDNGSDDGDGPPKGEQQCLSEECQQKFNCEPYYSVSYTTYKVPCWNGEPHEWDKTHWFADEDKKGHRSCKCCSKGEWVSR